MNHKENVDVTETITINTDKIESEKEVIDKTKAKKFCVHCGAQIGSNAHACSNCSAPLGSAFVQIHPENASQNFKKPLATKLKQPVYIGIIVASIVIAILIAAMFWLKEHIELNNIENSMSNSELESNDFDADGDDLSQKEEAANATDPNLYDTDHDGLSDGEEVSIFHTDPSVADTDGDGLIDGIEIKMGLNPLKTCSDNIINDAEKKIDYTFTDSNCFLTVNGSAKVISSINSRVIDKNILKNSDGVVGDIYSIHKSCDEEFDSATISFYYDEELRGINEGELCIFYLNEETSKYERVPSVIDKDSNIVSAELPHFSLYILGQAYLEYATFSIEYESIKDSDNEVNAVKIADSGFVLHKHSFAFHNFRSAYHGGADGNCYGISMVAYLNYLRKLPRCGDEYNGFVMDGPAYTISDSSRFAANQLYLEAENDLLNTANNYDVYKINSNDLSQDMIETFACIMHWQGRQHNVSNRFSTSIDSNKGFNTMASEILQGKPVILAIIKSSLKDSDSFYHYVLAYGIYRAENEIYVLIYDSNRPGEKCYIKMSESFGIITSAKYGEYSNIRIANVEIPTGPYVSHSCGMLSGEICEETDYIKAIPNASIDIYKDGELYTSTVSNAIGHYELFLPADEYSLKISADGYIEYNSNVAITESETIHLESFLKNATEINTNRETPLFTGEYNGQVDTSGEAYFRKVLWDKSAKVSGGISTNNYCFEYIELQSNSPAYSKINKALFDIAESSMNTNYDGEDLVGAGGGASYSAYSSVINNRNGILCVSIFITEASFDANTCTNQTSYIEQYYCFSLRTGEHLTLADLAETDEDVLLRDIRQIAWEGLCSEFDSQLLEGVEEWIYNMSLDEFRFGINNGEIILSFLPKEVSSVSYKIWPITIPTGIYISGCKK